jgi:hypothetical protein
MSAHAQREPKNLDDLKKMLTKPELSVGGRISPHACS